MSIERARTHLQQVGLVDHLIETDHSSATVELAAQALGVEPRLIAKSLTFLVGERTVMVVIAGDARLDNKAFKDAFGVKARMLAADQVEPRVGHAIGGVCPFGVEPGVEVYLDESLRRFPTVYPAGGNDRSGVRLTLDELEQAASPRGWLSVTRIPGA